MREDEYWGLKELVIFMKEQNIILLKMPGGLEVQLPSNKIDSDVNHDDAPTNTLPALGVERGGEPTEEQLMHWSAPGDLPVSND